MTSSVFFSRGVPKWCTPKCCLGSTLAAILILVALGGGLAALLSRVESKSLTTTTTIGRNIGLTENSVEFLTYFENIQHLSGFIETVRD